MKENPVDASENYPIRKVSENSGIRYDEQPVYTELKNVSCMKNLQSKSKTFSNNPKMSHPTKVQVSWNTIGNNDDDLRSL